jgi:hypothetical protein
MRSRMQDTAIRFIVSDDVKSKKEEERNSKYVDSNTVTPYGNYFPTQYTTINGVESYNDLQENG